MRRAVVSLLAGAAVLVVVGCSGSDPSLTNKFGDCTFEVQAVCTHQDLQSLSLQASDLTGADFSGSDMTNTDLSNTLLRDAKLVGTNLSGVDLTGADLRGADLSGATLFRAHLEHADWTGADRSNAKYCETFFPDGTVSDCKDLEVSGGTGKSPPPSVTSFAVLPPGTCLNDALGQGIEVDWKVRNANAVAFMVDDVRASTAAGTHGVKRVPVPCDGKQHRFTLQAFGAAPPLATKSFSTVVGR
ncbi:MAG: pentapeptide repeat-containing protein [Acidimicrobiia bacterium]